MAWFHSLNSLMPIRSNIFSAGAESLLPPFEHQETYKKKGAE